MDEIDRLLQGDLNTSLPAIADGEIARLRKSVIDKTDADIVFTTTGN